MMNIGGKFEVGERIVIKLNGGENFEGDFVRGTDKRIEIENIHHYETGNKIESIYPFYCREIDTIYKLDHGTNSKENKVIQSDSIVIPREEYDRLKEMANNFIYVKSDDKTYYDALNQLSNFESIGVVAVGAAKGRSGKISLIALSNWKEVYIFDLKNFRSKKFPHEIAGILESFYIKKVVHNGGTLKDCLQYSHGIIMNNVFDTQVSHLLITKNLSGKCPSIMPSIGVCLTEYFNFPSTLLTSSLDSLKESWEDRPLEEDKLKKLSRLVTYLITVKEHQMSLMLKDYDKAVDDYHNLFTKSSDFQMLKRSSTEECTEDIDAIIPMDLLKFESIVTVKID